MKKPRRRTWKKSGNQTSRPKPTGGHNLALCTAFQKRFSEGGTVKEIAAEMRIPKTTAYRWAFAVRLAVADWFRREGFGEAKLVQEWIKQAKRSHGHVLNGALREIGSILDAYPAKKEPAPPVGPAVVNYNTNIAIYKEMRYAPGEISVTGSVQDEPQGNAGSGTPEGAIARRGLRDPEKGSGQARV